MVNTALTDTVALEEDPAGWLGAGVVEGRTDTVVLKGGPAGWLGGGGDNVNKSAISCMCKH